MVRIFIVDGTGLPTPARLSITREAGVGTRFRFTGLTDRAFRAEFSENLLNPWLSFPGTVISGPDGIIEFLDPTLPLPARRFYRLALPP